MGFHYPVPFFFYLFAVREAAFHNPFQFSPAPVNAGYLAQIAFSTDCPFLAIHIFDVNLDQLLLPARPFFQVN